MQLTRREFAHSALQLVAIAEAIDAATPALATAAADQPCGRQRQGQCRAACTLYDPRFELALEAAQASAADSPIRAVTGDVTDLAPALLDELRANQTLIIRGVTTDTVPFCLEHLARSSGSSRLNIQRLNRDLFIWTLTVERR